jgi:hypothetical protein
MTIAQKSFQFQVISALCNKTGAKIKSFDKNLARQFVCCSVFNRFFYMFIPQQVKMSLKGLSSEISAAKSKINR